ncbi:MAG TPA: biotin/lipoate--protein ligase family protein [Xanthobacteraceae bacterium]|jgi:biotin-(acetyl-CoA carboxylase) ligase|nr:biotin/lipoate--protein ligase family protein [Xanthobacteraceae bacterium]
MRTPFAASLELPPPFRLVTLRELGDAFAHAMAIAANEGAGTLVWVGRFDLVEFAVVLEPDEPLRLARRSIYAGLNALADALVAHAPPEKSISIDWPDAIRVDGGLVGGARLGWPAGARENDLPSWLVFGATIRTVSMTDHEAGLRPLGAALEDEGFDDLGSGRLVESFARHLMLTLDCWQESGFDSIAKAVASRLSLEPGTEQKIDAAGDLLVRRADRAEVKKHKLTPALAMPSWLDPQTGGPRI